MAASSKRVSRWIWAGLVLAGCGDSADGAAPSGAGASAAGTNAAGSPAAGSPAAGSDAPPDGPLYGFFAVEAIPEMPATPLKTASPARTKVSGQLRDGVAPATLTPGWTEMDSADGCALLEVDHPFCDPVCDGTDLCVPPGMCLPVPEKRSAGTARVEGLGEPFEIEDTVVGNYMYVGSPLPYPPCAEGDAIVISAAGKAPFEPFSLEAPCVPPMEITAPITIEAGQPAELRWTAPAMTELARVHVKLDISHHGGLRAKIECDLPDTGSFDIPATLIDGLIDLGVAGFPSIVLTRRTTDQGDDEQTRNVTLSVESGTETLVTIPGLESCTDDSHCPMGKTCNNLDSTCI